MTCISRATGTPTGGGFDGLVNELDYMLVYARNITAAVINGLAMNEDDARIYNQIDEDGNRYLTRSLRRTGGEDRREDRPTMYYPLIAPDGTEVYPIGPTGYESRWICAPETAKKLEEDGLIEWRKTDLLGKKVWHPYQKYYLENRTKAPGNIWQDFFWPPDDTNHEFLWTDIEGNKKATRDIRDLFDGQKVFETAKPIGLLEKVLTIGSNDGDIIVDFFSGSATTAHAIMRMNAVTQGKRKYILIQLQEPVKPGSDAEKAGYTTIDQIGMDRILRAAVKIREKYPDTTVDLGFKHYTLVEPEQNTLDKLEKFDPTENKLFADKDILSDFGKPTVLATWLVRDGYGLTAEAEELNFAGYNGYYIGKHLYLIDPELSNKAIEAL